jgi:polar amino acid transport system permease protein
MTMADVATLERSALLRGGRRRRRRQQAVRTILYLVLLAAAAAVAVFADWPLLQRQFANVPVALDMFPRVLTVAAKNTILYTATSYTFGLVLGLVLALMKLSTIRAYRLIATVYIEIFRGLPALLTLFLIAFGIPLALGIRMPFGVLGRITLGLGIVAAAYVAEVLRAGIEAVPKGQMEAARSLGMSHGRAMATIVIPQAFRIVIPPLTNELVLLIKDTSLVFIIGTTPMAVELTKLGRDMMFLRGNPTPLIVVGLVYLAITIPMTRLVAALERRMAAAR